jgi:PAS domain S-box-containing protein
MTEELLAMVLRTAMDGCWIVDAQGRFVEVNGAYCELVGYSRDELLGMGIADVEAAESPAEIAAHVQKVRAQGTGRFVTRHRRKDGEILDVEVSAHYVPHDGGLFCVFVRDISERMGRERALRDSREGLRRDLHDRAAENALQAAALEAAANAIVIADHGGIIRWVNPAFTTLTGYRAEEIIGQTLRALKSGTHDRQFYARLWETILAGRVWQGEMINRRRDGTLYTESQTITPVRDGQGAIAHFVAVKQDITEQKLLEDELRQAQKMEAVGRLAGGVAHDFNNLLTVIQGRSALLQAHLAPDHPLRRHADLIDQASLRGGLDSSVADL